MMRLRDELMGLSGEMNDRLKDILERFGEEAYDKETDEGLLEVSLKDYQSCFSVDAEKVQALLWQEEKRMRDELTKAEDDADRLKGEMNVFLSENQEGLEKFLRTAEGQVKVLAVAHRERQEMKDEMKQLGRYDSEMVAVLDSKAPKPKAEEPAVEV